MYLCEKRAVLWAFTSLRDTNPAWSIEYQARKMGFAYVV